MDLIAVRIEEVHGANGTQTLAQVSPLIQLNRDKPKSTCADSPVRH